MALPVSNGEIEDDEALALTVARKLSLDCDWSQHPSPSGRKTNKSYVVFHGREPGVYGSWERAQAQIKDFSENIYEGYPTEIKAKEAFLYAEERGWTRSESTSLNQFNPKIRPTPVTHENPNTHDASRFMRRANANDKWYVVYHGVRPGVYGSWLETAITVNGFSGNIHEAYPTEMKAKEAFQYAEERGWTRSESTSLDQFNPKIRPTPVTHQDSDAHDASQFMPRAKDGKWYVVHRGIRPGIYGTWLEAAINSPSPCREYKTKKEASEALEAGIENSAM